LRAALLLEHERRHLFEVLAHVFGDGAETDRGEKVDREARVARVVERENVAEVGLERLVLEPFDDVLEAHAFDHLLEHDLDKDTRRRGRVVLVHLDRVEHRPRDGVGHHEVAKEARNVAQPVRLVAVDRRVVVDEALLVRVGPDLVDLAEPFAHQAVELAKGPLLRATLDDHVAQLGLRAWPRQQASVIVRARRP
jgi:hypothetical protein